MLLLIQCLFDFFTPDQQRDCEDDIADERGNDITHGLLHEAALSQ